MQPRLSELIDEGVARGIITPQQRDELLKLAGHKEDGPRGFTGEFLAWAREAPRGFNAITVAYGVGALAVVFALVWFLADRWSALGPPGVLIVSIVYVAVFGSAASVFTRERFPIAHGVSVLLMVVTAPLIAWAALRVTTVWTDDFGRLCSARDAPFWGCGSRAVVLAGVTLAATLAAMRRLRFGPLMIPGAAALGVIFGQLALEASRGDGGRPLLGWAMTFTASMLVTIAYETDRRHGRQSYSGWIHIAAAVCATIALLDLFAVEPQLRHLLLPTSVAAMAASLFLRRVVWLVVGLGGLFSYLMWLAREVFERAVAFPVILAAVGLSIILVTVWVQRTYPRIAARIRESDGAMARFPGGAGLLLAPALVAVLVMPAARADAIHEERQRRAEAAWSSAIARREAGYAPRVRPIRDLPVVRPPPDSAAMPDSVAQQDTLPPADSVPPPDTTATRGVS